MASAYFRRSRNCRCRPNARPRRRRRCADRWPARSAGVGSSSPFTASRISAPGLSARNCAASASAAPSPAMSVLVITSRSARIACRRASDDQVSVSPPVSASTTVTTASTWNTSPSARSVAKVCRIGEGSARPEVSITMRLEGGDFAALALDHHAAQRLLQVGARDAAQAAVAEQHGLVGRRAHQRVVDAGRAELVDHHRGALPLRRRRGSGAAAWSCRRRGSR